MYGYNNPTATDVRLATNALRDLGVSTVRLEFSGGNDEGGIDHAEYLDADGNPVEVPKSGAYERTYYQGGKEHNDGWVVYDRSISENWSEQYRPATDEEILWGKVNKVLCAPVYAKYYTFAGEFYVDGTLTWDVDKGTYEMHGQEETRSWESF